MNTHQSNNLFSLGLALVVLVAINFMIATSAHAADGWCQSFANGYDVGYCFRNDACTPPPITCPIPLPGEDTVDAYMAGLKVGLADKKVARNG